MDQILIKQSNIYRYNLYGEITNFSDYNNFIEDLATMSSSDAVALYINCMGGRVDVGVSIINAIQSSEAPVTAIVEGPTYSMGSVIALAGKKLIMLDNTFLMFHNYSGVAYGKGGELMTSMRHSDNHNNKLMENICHPFLTRTELKKIQKDEDVYIYNDDKTLDKRNERHFK